MCIRDSSTEELENIRLIINAEAQNRFKLKYPLTKRAVYYGSRLISAQNGTVFTKSDYQKLLKVYSCLLYTSKVEVTGTAPYAFVTYTNNSSDTYIKSLEYVITVSYTHLMYRSLRASQPILYLVQCMMIQCRTRLQSLLSQQDVMVITEEPVVLLRLIKSGIRSIWIHRRPSVKMLFFRD